MAVEVEAGAYMNHISMIFSHNPLHDIESLWWVGVWFLVCHYQPGNLRDTTVQQHIKIAKEFGETLFNNRVNLSRRHALIGPTLLANIVPLSFPKAVQHLIVLLNSFRVQLVAHYTLYKPKASQDRSFFNPDLHRKFADVVEEAMKELGNDQTGLWLIGDVEKRIAFLNAKK
jgi:hypothetical protein